MLDFLSIGDITTDAFIDLKDLRIDTDPDEGDRGSDEICFRFGDKIEYEDATVVRAVGNSPNAAVSATRLGLNASLYSNLGDDDNGKACVEALKERGVSTDHLKIHPGKETNYHYVLRYQAERTILVKHHVYPYALPEFSEPPRWIYFSSVGETAEDFHHEVATYVKEHDETKLAFQPGTFQIELGYEKLKDIYEACEIFFCNKEEAQLILETKENDIKELLKEMHARGPQIAVVTDGPEGAYAFDGSEAWHMPMYPDPAPPVDRTGAGDAFSSTFTSVLALGKTIPEALTWAPVNSMSVVQHIGAQEGLLKRENLEQYLETAPEDYKPTEL